MVSQKLKHAMAVVGCAIILLNATGCQETPPTNADEVLDYVRNASVGAQVRKLDVGAQAYVDSVMKAYRDWEVPWQAVVADVEKLSPFQSDESSNATDITELLVSIPKRLADLEIGEENSRLGATVNNVPDLPGGTETRDGPLAKAILRLIMPRDGELGHESSLMAHLGTGQAYNAVLKECTDKVASKPKDPDPMQFQKDILECLRSARHQIRIKMAEDRIGEFMTKIKDHRKQRDEVIEKKKEIRDEGLDDMERFRSYRSLEILVFYHDAIVKTAEKKLRSARAKIAKDNDNAKSGEDAP